MAVVGIQSLAETDYNPESALVSQLVFATLISHSNPNSIIINLLSAAIAQAGANKAGNISFDFKIRSLVGAQPQAQTYGQIVGSLFSALISCSIYKLYTSQYPIPGPLFRVLSSYLVLSTARLVMGRGLPEGVAPFALGAAIFSTLVTVIKMRYETRWWQKLIPSGVSFALGIYNVPSVTITRTLGGILFWVHKQRSGGRDGSIMILASGLVLGESIASLVTLALTAAHAPKLGGTFVPNAPNIISTASEEDITNSFAVIHNITTGTSANFGPSTTDVDHFATYKAESNPSLLFLRGYAFPPMVGNDWRKIRRFYSSPSLPSSSSRVYQLNISTVCCRNVVGAPYEPEDLQDSRKLETQGLGRYFKTLRNRAQVADSMVGPPRDNWRAVIWLDSGKDLSKGVEGPWSPRPGTRPWETRFFPVIVHQVGSTQSRSRNRSHLAPRSVTYPASSYTIDPYESGTEWRAAQNICLLPYQYGSTLDNNIAGQGALRISHELSFTGQQSVGRPNAISLLNIRFIKTQLMSHAQRLAETVRILENLDSLDWPRAIGSPKAEKAAHLLLIDLSVSTSARRGAR
ncbi:hypothetical protein AJ80_03870 [Polytolypa hystricis UAMH7299]|uniref:Uncharacterized protein n=1 Tax=Polytolypa hystricis (strain UAMH7299) TaxID=1447883 RepID=A0A2B7YE35_POLH7|nr:hypothetical protein AJ80_03870 [Polytolypa hystricis UAMH7299]